MRPKSALRVAVAAVLLLLPVYMAAKDQEFSGSLQRVTPGALTIRLSDGSLVDARIPATGDLSAKTIIARYNVADQMQILCKPNMELKNLRFLRHPSAEELAEVATSLAWRREENLLKIPAAGARPAAGVVGAFQAEFEHARRISLERAANMPDFVADETAKRYTSPRTNPPVWRLVDTIESEISFQKGEATRQHVRINGKPWNKPDFPGLSFSVEFGTDLKSVFDPECGNAFDFAGREESNEKHLLVFRFRSPADGCFGYHGAGVRRYIPARTGRVVIDDPGGNVIRYELEAVGFPKGWALDTWKDTELWDNLKVGDASHFLPVSFESMLGFAPGELWRVSVQYSNHRHFEASTHFTFH